MKPLLTSKAFARRTAWGANKPGMAFLVAIGTALLATALLPGCSAGPSASPSPTPPQIVMTEGGLKQWDRPEAFGPVPAALLATAREYCATMNHSGKRFVPAGYHAHALSVDGFPFEDGGFYCVQQ